MTVVSIMFLNLPTVGSMSSKMKRNHLLSDKTLYTDHNIKLTLKSCNKDYYHGHKSTLCLVHIISNQSDKKVSESKKKIPLGHHQPNISHKNIVIIKI